MTDQGLFLEMVDIAPDLEGEFNTWYNQTQIPALKRIPGALDVRRYRAVQGQPRYLALCEVSDVAALDQPDLSALLGWGAEGAAARLFAGCSNVVRGAYRVAFCMPSEGVDLSIARGLLANGTEVAAEHEEEVSDWYNTEHIPALLGTPGSIRGCRIQLVSRGPAALGNPPSYFGVFDLERPEVQATEEWKRRATSPWAERTRRFRTPRMRNVYERINPA